MAHDHRDKMKHSLINVNKFNSIAEEQKVAFNNRSQRKTQLLIFIKDKFKQSVIESSETKPHTKVF